MARAYSVFANGGYLIEPHIIQTISNQAGDIVYEHEKIVLCDDCEGKLAQNEERQLETKTQANNQTKTLEIEDTNSLDLPEITQEEVEPFATFYPDRVLSAANQFITESFMKDVIKRGTGRKALALNRIDIAGKTGTTNDQVDAWFNGFQRNIVTHAWVGFDSPEPMGRAETGGAAALPIWIDYMRVALEGVDVDKRLIPPGVIAAKINRLTGNLASPYSSDAILEYFTIGNLPKEENKDEENIEFNSDPEDDLF
jgi:penicillin-binding protein 1A